MRDHNHRAALFGDRAHHPQHFTDQFRVQRRRGLVKQHDFGLHCQRARNGNALLFATGQVRRKGILAVVHAYTLQVSVGALHGFSLGQLERVHGCFDDVFNRRHVCPQVEVLEHHRHFAAQSLQLGSAGHLERAAFFIRHQTQLLAVQRDAAGIGLFQQIEATQKRAFPGAAGADHRDHIAFFGAHADALQDLVVAKALVDAFSLQN